MNDRQDSTPLAASHISKGTERPDIGRARRDSGGRVARLPKLKAEVDARIPATRVGGVGLFLTLWRKLGISKEIDDSVHVLMRHRPYHESDHVLAHVLNLYTGGTCIEDQVALQMDDAVLRMLGADRFPDPTTSGDFLRRFDDEINPGALMALRAVGDRMQDRVWSTLRREDPKAFGRLGSTALVDLDSTVVEVSGTQKEGVDFSYNGKWSHHPLLLTLANTGEVLAVRDRPGNAHSATGAARLLDGHLPRVSTAFDSTVVRGDSAFDQKEIRETCRSHGACFSTVAAKRARWHEDALSMAEDAWTPWSPPAQRRAEEAAAKESYRSRKKGTNHRRRAAERRSYENEYTVEWSVAETTTIPTKDEDPCRLIIIREARLNEYGPLQLFHRGLYRYRYIVTNLPSKYSTSDVVDTTYQRCNQENIIQQLGSGITMLRTPVREAAGNDAWMEMARLAWNLAKALGLLALPLETIRWEMKRFRSAFVYLAAEVRYGARQTWLRFNPSHRYIPTVLRGHCRLGP